MNLNELNVIADQIRMTEKSIDGISYEEVRKDLIRKHNESVDTYNSICDFIANNMSIFENGKGGWTFRNKLYHTDYCIGHNNPYNCVIRDIQHEDVYKYKSYWIDGGIHFKVNSNGIVYFVSDMRPPTKHGYSDGECWNRSNDYIGYNYLTLKGIDTDHLTEFKMTKWNDETLKDLDGLNVAHTKKLIDEDYEHINKVMEKLMWSLRAINESIMKRLNERISICDSVNTVKTTKYIIELTKVEK